jgi:hypothetical protein
VKCERMRTEKGKRICGMKPGGLDPPLDTFILVCVKGEEKLRSSKTFFKGTKAILSLYEGQSVKVLSIFQLSVLMIGYLSLRLNIGFTLIVGF